jgi:hypothetical protein
MISRLMSGLIEPIEPRLNMGSKSHMDNRQIMFCIMCICMLLVSTSIIFVDLQGQSDDNVRRPNTSRVVPINYTATVTNFKDLSFYEISPNVSKALTSDKNIVTPLASSPPYTVTNATITFGTDILRSDLTSAKLYVFIANKSENVINDARP